MSSAHDEARALTRGALVLLAISLLRYGSEVVARFAPSGASEGTALVDSLGAATRAAIEEDELRTRLLRPGETIDPNTADAAGLDRLPGIGPATARAIVAARDSGVVFRDGPDLLVVRGVGPSTLARLRPHLSFRGAVGLGASGARREEAGTTPPARRPPQSGAVDLNSADEAALVALPGVGPALAARIVAERRDRPFASLDDLQRVRGIGPATVTRLRGLAVARRIP